MKKYFVKETDEELQYGDVVGITFEKELEDGHVTLEKEIEFTEGMEDYLVGLGIIEEKEDLISFEDDAPADYCCEELKVMKELLEGLQKDFDDFKKQYNTPKKSTKK